MDLSSGDILDHFDLNSKSKKKPDHHDMRHSSSRSHKQKKKKKSRRTRVMEEEDETEVFGRRIQSRKTRRGGKRNEVIFLEGEFDR